MLGALYSNIHPSELKAKGRLSHLSALISFCQTGQELNELLWGDCHLRYSYRLPFESISLLGRQKRQRSVYQYSNSYYNIKLLSSEELPSTFFQALIKHQVKKIKVPFCEVFQAKSQSPKQWVQQPVWGAQLQKYVTWAYASTCATQRTRWGGWKTALHMVVCATAKMSRNASLALGGFLLTLTDLLSGVLEFLPNSWFSIELLSPDSREDDYLRPGKLLNVSPHPAPFPPLSWFLPPDQHYVRPLVFCTSALWECWSYFNKFLHVGPEEMSDCEVSIKFYPYSSSCKRLTDKICDKMTAEQLDVIVIQTCRD